MKNLQKPCRRSIRLQQYDYATPGAYFITICANKRKCIFGRVIDNEIQLNEYGLIVHNEWLQTFSIRPNIELDEFVIMPNHFHAIIWITGFVGAARCAPTDANDKLAPGSLPTIIRSFKSAVTKRINELRNTPDAAIWQRGYYEHIIRRDESLHEIRQYIRNNPYNWATDPENPNI